MIFLPLLQLLLRLRKLSKGGCVASLCETKSDIGVLLSQPRNPL